MWARLFGRRSGPEKLQPDNVRVLCNEKTYNVVFEDTDYTTNAEGTRKGVTLGFLRDKLQQIVGSPVDIYQLRPKRRLSDPAMFLADYEVYTDDRLLGIVPNNQEETGAEETTPKPKRKKNKKSRGGAGHKSHKHNRGAAAPAVPAAATSTPATPPPPPKPLTPREQIESVIEDVDTNIKPHIDKFVSSPPESAEERTDIHRRLGETILQKMLKLDDVETDGNDELRTMRKQAINTMHNYHEALDQAYKKASQPE